MNDFEQQIKNIYSKDLEQKKTWYSSVAAAYNRTRPRYPLELINLTLELTQLPAHAKIMEIGCGPGTATIAFAKLGFSMVCLEPSQDAFQLAQFNCTKYPKVEIKNTTFEEWELEAEKFDAVLAATSFHWVSADIAYSKAAKALKDNGSLILLWNTPPQPNNEVSQLLNEVYKTHAPSLALSQDRETHQENLRKFGKAVIDSGQFENLISEQFIPEVSYSIDNYLGLLSTLSPYIALEPQKRDSLFASLREVLEKNCPGSIQTSYLSVLQIAQKI